MLDQCVLNFVGNSFPTEKLMHSQPKVLDIINRTNQGSYSVGGSLENTKPNLPNTFTNSILRYNLCTALILKGEMFENGNELNGIRITAYFVSRTLVGVAHHNVNPTYVIFDITDNFEILRH